MAHQSIDPPDTLPADPAPAEEFDRRFRRLVERLRWRATLRAASGLLPWLQLAWLALFLPWRLGWAGLLAFLPTTLAVLLAAGLGAMALAALRTPHGGAAALILDRRLKTRELVTAAHETDPASRHPFVRRVRQQAAAVLDGPEVAASFPLTRPLAWRAAGLGLVALVLAVFVPRPPAAVETVAVDPAVTATAEALAEEVEDLAEQLELAERPESEDAFARLQELVEELQQGEVPTVEEALVELARVEETLSSLQEELAADGFDELIRDLAAEPMAAELAQAMTAADREALHQALTELAESLPASAAEAAQRQQEMERLAQRFDEMANLLEAVGWPEHAAALRELAEALRAGDLERARELLESDAVAGACKAAGGFGLFSGNSRELQELIQLARFLLGTGRPKALGEGDSAQQSGRGSGPGPGLSSTNTEASSGHKTGDPILRHRQTGDTSERTGSFEAVYDSRLGKAESTEDVRATSQIGEAGEMLSREGRGLGIEEPATLPLKPFSSFAAGAPERAVDLENVPLGYRELVRNYFERPTAKSSAGQGDPP